MERGRCPQPLPLECTTPWGREWRGCGRGAHCSAGKGKEGRRKAGTVEAVLGGKGRSQDGPLVCEGSGSFRATSMVGLHGLSEHNSPLTPKALVGSAQVHKPCAALTRCPEGLPHPHLALANKEHPRTAHRVEKRSIYVHKEIRLAKYPEPLAR